ncbi:MAG: alpha/beta hydrolase [Chitinophagaceae bacterium]
MKFLRRLLWSLLVLFVLLNLMSAFHAYKFTHFYDDPGLQRLKPEEMSMGQKLSAICFGVKSPKSINDVLPEVPYETIQLYTHDSLKLEGWLCKKDSSKGTVILFHGHGSSKSKVLQEAMYFYSIGYNTLLMDFRAHGGSDGNTCTIGYNEAEDVKLAYDYISAREKNVFIWGISLGAATITRAVSEYNIQPSGVILELPFGSLLGTVKGRVRTMGLPSQPISSLLTFWGGAEQGFWAFDHNPCNYATKINCPVLLQCGAKDARVSMEEINCIYAAMPSAKKKLVVYEESAHQSLCKNEPEKWKREVAQFLDSGK